MNILVTGGAGYIGSHTVKMLKESGHAVTIFDSLEYGHKEVIGALAQKPRLIEGNLTDSALLNMTFQEGQFEAVMHFAAYAQVAESVADPGKYFWNNTAGTIQLLNTMVKYGVHHFVFSSTCAVYGIPEAVPITEDEPKKPESPYGTSKLLCEMAITDMAKHTPLKATLLRYFNACGADTEGELGEDHTPETHLIPLILQVALGQRQEIKIYGTDYPTKDGTAVRDYIHVSDLANAHIMALDKQQRSDEKLAFYNIGTGQGYSVKEIIAQCREITQHTIPSIEADRRPGDPPELIADPQKIKQDLGWEPQYSSIETIVQTAWDWHKNHTQGYAQ